MDRPYTNREHLQPFFRKFPQWTLTCIALVMFPVYFFAPFWTYYNLFEAMDEWWEVSRMEYLTKEEIQTKMDSSEEEGKYNE